jgi:hypothetical protein
LLVFPDVLVAIHPLVFQDPKHVECVAVIRKERLKRLYLRVVTTTESTKEKPMTVRAYTVAHAGINLAATRRNGFEAATLIDGLNW